MKKITRVIEYEGDESISQLTFLLDQMKLKAKDVDQNILCFENITMYEQNQLLNEIQVANIQS